MALTIVNPTAVRNVPGCRRAAIVFGEKLIYWVSAIEDMCPAEEERDEEIPERRSPVSAFRGNYSVISAGSTPIARTTYLKILITVLRLSVRRGLRGCLRSFLATVVIAFAQASDVSDNPVWPGVSWRHAF